MLMVRNCLVILAAFGLAASGGCKQSPSQVAPAEAPALPVSKPVQREVTDYVDFTARTDAVEAVDIRPRVSGYVVRMPFREGSAVKKGELLFEIDPRPYQAQFDQAMGQVALNEASLRLAKTIYDRDSPLVTQAAISQQQLEQDKATMTEAQARVKAAQASLEVFKLNLAFTKVTSPIDGQVSRYYLTLGNLVNQDQTLLTTVMSLDPMYVYFDMDEPTLLRLRKAGNAGQIKPAPSPLSPATGERGRSEGVDGQFAVLMGLQGEDGFPHRGTLNFVNNQVNTATGSITMRGVFPNPKPDGGTRLLSPGMFVRVRLPIGQPYPALLVLDRAIGSDQGQKFVYVVDAEHKVQYRRITTGALQGDGLRVITQGLNAEDTVLVGGLQQVRPHTAIQPEPREMPTLGEAPPAAASGGQDTQPAGGKKAGKASATSSK
jgi:multidrug efflux system membrane fusion protein